MNSLSFSVSPAFSFFFFFFFFGCPVAYGIPNRGSGSTHSWDLSSSCSNTRSLTRCAGPGIKPASQCSQNIANLFGPQQEFLFILLLTPISGCSIYSNTPNLCCLATHHLMVEMVFFSFPKRSLLLSSHLIF